jgi:ribosome-associated protein
MTRITIPFSEYSFSFSRSGGAGGQNVNKVNSKVTLEWNLNATEAITYSVKERFRLRYKGFINEEGIVQIISQKTRSQKDNIDDCIQKLQEMIQEVLIPPKIRKATKPKKSAVLKRLNTKKKDSEKKRLRKSDY